MRALLLASMVSLSALAQPQQSATWSQRFDSLWKERDRPGAEKLLHAILKEPLAKDANDFEANWRLATLLNWQADEVTGGELKAALGKAAWQAGEKVVAAKPNDVRGQYLAGTGIGLYSEGVGILTALGEGLEGKFRDRIQAALRLDRHYLKGAPQVVWGRYFFRLPWPKRDVGESIRVLRTAVQEHPDNLRARLFLAESLAEDGHGDEAKQQAQAVVSARASDDPPEDRRLKSRALKWLAGH